MSTTGRMQNQYVIRYPCGCCTSDSGISGRTYDKAEATREIKCGIEDYYQWVQDQFDDDPH